MSTAICPHRLQDLPAELGLKRMLPDLFEFRKQRLSISLKLVDLDHLEPVVHLQAIGEG